jgi:hypothetical protein
MPQRVYEDGQALISYGERGDELFLIRYGKVCSLLNAVGVMRNVQGWPEPYIYTVYIWYFWQGNHQIYGHIRCLHTVLANPLSFGSDSLIW